MGLGFVGKKFLDFWLGRQELYSLGSASTPVWKFKILPLWVNFVMLCFLTILTSLTQPSILTRTVLYLLSNSVSKVENKIFLRFLLMLIGCKFCPFSFSVIFGKAVFKFFFCFFYRTKYFDKLRLGANLNIRQRLITSKKTNHCKFSN